MSNSVVRSPSYPSLSLEEAIEAVRKIDGRYRSAAVDRLNAAKLIGFTTQSGPANQALASLAAYGLLERAGKGDTRVTERARAILHPDTDEERLQNVLAAAWSPPLFEKLRERFEGVQVPPEDGVETALHRMNFNPRVVRRAAKAFLGTCQYVEEQRVVGGHGDSRADDQESSHSGTEPARVGDLVQWQSLGVDQFPNPRRVRAVSEDGEWVFVEDSETGLPTVEIAVIESAKVDDVAPPTMPLPDKPIGEAEWLRSRIGKNTSVRLMVTGSMGPIEIDRLIRVLRTQYDVLAEDEGEE